MNERKLAWLQLVTTLGLLAFVFYATRWLPEEWARSADVGIRAAVLIFGSAYVVMTWRRRRGLPGRR